MLWGGGEMFFLSFFTLPLSLLPPSPSQLSENLSEVLTPPSVSVSVLHLIYTEHPRAGKDLRVISSLDKVGLGHSAWLWVYVTF